VKQVAAHVIFDLLFRVELSGPSFNLPAGGPRYRPLNVSRGTSWSSIFPWGLWLDLLSPGLFHVEPHDKEDSSPRVYASEKSTIWND
jgi:hypothetical protein